MQVLQSVLFCPRRAGAYVNDAFEDASPLPGDSMSRRRTVHDRAYRGDAFPTTWFNDPNRRTAKRSR